MASVQTGTQATALGETSSGVVEWMKVTAVPLAIGLLVPFIMFCLLKCGTCLLRSLKRNGASGSSGSNDAATAADVEAGLEMSRIEHSPQAGAEEVVLVMEPPREMHCLSNTARRTPISESAVGVGAEVDSKHELPQVDGHPHAGAEELNENVAEVQMEPPRETHSLLDPVKRTSTAVAAVGVAAEVEAGQGMP